MQDSKMQDSKDVHEIVLTTAKSTGYWGILHHAAPCVITIDGATWPTVLHYFYAAQLPRDLWPGLADIATSTLPLLLAELIPVEHVDWEIVKCAIQVGLRAKCASVECAALLAQYARVRIVVEEDAYLGAYINAQTAAYFEHVYATQLSQIVPRENWSRYLFSLEQSVFHRVLIAQQIPVLRRDLDVLRAYLSILKIRMDSTHVSTYFLSMFQKHPYYSVFSARIKQDRDCDIPILLNCFPGYSPRAVYYIWCFLEASIRRMELSPYRTFNQYKSIADTTLEEQRHRPLDTVRTMRYCMMFLRDLVLQHRPTYSPHMLAVWAAQFAWKLMALDELTDDQRATITQFQRAYCVPTVTRGMSPELLAAFRGYEVFAHKYIPRIACVFPELPPHALYELVGALYVVSYANGIPASVRARFALYQTFSRGNGQSCKKLRLEQAVHPVYEVVRDFSRPAIKDDTPRGGIFDLIRE